MPAYDQMQWAPQQQKSAGSGAAEHRTAERDHARATDALGASLNESPRSRSLAQLRATLDGSPRVQSQLALQRALNDTAPVAKKTNATGLPDRLKAGVEQLSGLALDDVRVHYNSSKPAAVQAHAYAQGTDIHVAPGQEQHLPHEAWHVVQQKQGRVKPTLQLQASVGPTSETIQLLSYTWKSGQGSASVEENGANLTLNGSRNDMQAGKVIPLTGSVEAERYEFDLKSLDFPKKADIGKPPNKEKTPALRLGKIIVSPKKIGLGSILTYEVAEKAQKQAAPYVVALNPTDDGDGFYQTLTFSSAKDEMKKKVDALFAEADNLEKTDESNMTDVEKEQLKQRRAEVWEQYDVALNQYAAESFYYIDAKALSDKAYTALSKYWLIGDDVASSTARSINNNAGGEIRQAHAVAPIQAHAYARGTHIPVAPGQEQHLPHEAWHVVQQKQGRVKPTLQLKGVAINDDAGLEREADVMATRASRVGPASGAGGGGGLGPPVIQRLIDREKISVTAERIEQEKVVRTLQAWKDQPDESPDMELPNKVLREKIAERLARLDQELKAAQDEKAQLGELDAQSAAGSGAVSGSPIDATEQKEYQLAGAVGDQLRYKSVGYDRMEVGAPEDTLLTSGLGNCIAVVAWDPAWSIGVMGHYNTLDAIGTKGHREAELNKLKADLLGKLASNGEGIKYRVGLGTSFNIGEKPTATDKTLIKLRGTIKKIFGVEPIDGPGLAMTFQPGTGVASVVTGEAAKNLAEQWNSAGGDPLYYREKYTENKDDEWAQFPPPD